MKADSCLKLFQNPKLEVLLILIFFFKNLNWRFCNFLTFKKKLELEVISKIFKKSELEVIDKIRELHNTGYYLNT
jgi:hypothetical protein